MWTTNLNVTFPNSVQFCLKIANTCWEIAQETCTFDSSLIYKGLSFYCLIWARGPSSSCSQHSWMLRLLADGAKWIIVLKLLHFIWNRKTSLNCFQGLDFTHYFSCVWKTFLVATEWVCDTLLLTQALAIWKLPFHTDIFQERWSFLKYAPSWPSHQDAIL